MTPNVEGNRHADEMQAEDQGICRRVRLTVRLGLDPSHFTGSQGRDSCKEQGDERPEIGQAVGSSAQHYDRERQAGHGLLKGKISVDRYEDVALTMSATQ